MNNEQKVSLITSNKVNLIKSPPAYMLPIPQFIWLNKNKNKNKIILKIKI